MRYIIWLQIILPAPDYLRQITYIRLATPRAQSDGGCVDAV